MPYNLCSVLPLEEKLSMLKSARGFAGTVKIITIDSIITEAGFKIIDRSLLENQDLLDM